MLKHTVVAALLSLGLAVPAVAQTTVVTPKATTPRAARQAKSSSDQAALRANRKTARANLRASRTSEGTKGVSSKRHTKHRVKALRRKLNRLKRRHHKH